MDMKELLRRDVIRLMGLGGAGILLLPGSALAQEKASFRMDEQNSIHFLAGTFIPQFLTKPITWESKKFASSGQGRVSALARGAIDGIMTSWTYLVQIAFNNLPGTCLSGMAGGGSGLLVPANSAINSASRISSSSMLPRPKASIRLRTSSESISVRLPALLRLWPPDKWTPARYGSLMRRFS